MSTANANTPLLTVRKGSRAAPLLFLLLTVALFVVLALPAGNDELARNLGLEQRAEWSAKDIKTALDSDAVRTRIQTMLFQSPMNFFTKLLLPLLKAYLDQVASEFVQITRSTIGILTTFSLYALGPGLAGLVYRRSFWPWFTVSFISLVGLNASGLFGSLTSAQQMPESGSILFFILFQIVFILLAYRLRRHTPSVGWVSATVYNRTLTLLLWAVGLALAYYWQPLSGPSQATLSFPREAKLAGRAIAGHRDCIDECPALVRIEPLGPVAAASPAGPTTATSVPAATSDIAARIAEAAGETYASAARKLTPYYIAKFELTHGEWEACVQADGCEALLGDGKPSTDGKGGALSAPGGLPNGLSADVFYEHNNRFPVEVTYAQATAYAKWLSAKTGATYRLPTRLEWEHAVRGDSAYRQRWSFGNDESQLRDYAWTGDAPHHVGLKPAIATGLNDAYGNVAEWVDAPTSTGPQLRGGRAGTAAAAAMFETDLVGLPATIDGHPPTGGVRLVREVGTATPGFPPLPGFGGTALEPEAPQGRSAWSILSSGLTGWIIKWECILLGLPLLHTLLRNSNSWTARTRKNIVICLDGTTNTPDQLEAGFAAQTNVYKMFNMLKSDPSNGARIAGQYDASLVKRYGDKQIGFYYAGVGNKYDSDPILQTLGMATGLGASEIIERAYLDLVRVYQPGDRVFIVGFSRGAAIARLLARCIDARGAPRSVWTLRLFGKHRVLWSARERIA